MKTNKLLLSAAFVAISASGLSAFELENSGHTPGAFYFYPPAPVYTVGVAGTDTEALLESVHSHDLSQYLNLVRADKMAKVNAFIDSLAPGAGDQLLDHSVNLYGAMVNGLPIMLMDGTRESFKMALNQVIDSVNPVVAAPIDVRVDTLSRTKEQVDVAFEDAISAFIDSLVPGAGSPMIDPSMVHMHGAAIFGAYGQPMDGTRDSFKQALVNAIYQ